MLDRRQVEAESWQEVSRTWSSGASSKLPPLRDLHGGSLPDRHLHERSRKRTRFYLECTRLAEGSRYVSCYIALVWRRTGWHLVLARSWFCFMSSICCQRDCLLVLKKTLLHEEQTDYFFVCFIILPGAVAFPSIRSGHCS